MKRQSTKPVMNRKTLTNLAALAACALAGHTALATDSQQARWQFDVSLDGKPIGYHTFELEQDGAKQVLTTEASFDVKFLFVTAFRYRHRNTEIWSDGCLSSIDAATDSNGNRLEVRGSVGEAGFQVRSARGATALPACVQSFAYWNPSVLSSTKLLNSQTGVYETVSVELEGRDEVSVAGEAVEALRYRLSAEAGDIRLWYSIEDKIWLGLEAPAKGGRKILYQAAVVPEPGASPQLVARGS